MRFRPEQHLRRQDEIRAVRTEGRRLDARALTIWWRPRPPAPAASAGIERPRACVIASTAAVGNAIHRNRAKRRLRELFRAHQDRLPAHCDFLLIARAAAYDRPFAELEKNFLHACGLLKPGAEPAPHA
jgi:ribonuclease P protein component